MSLLVVPDHLLKSIGAPVCYQHVQKGCADEKVNFRYRKERFSIPDASDGADFMIAPLDFSVPCIDLKAVLSSFEDQGGSEHNHLLYDGLTLLVHLIEVLYPLVQASDNEQVAAQQAYNVDCMRDLNVKVNVCSVAFAHSAIEIDD